MKESQVSSKPWKSWKRIWRTERLNEWQHRSCKRKLKEAQKSPHQWQQTVIWRQLNSLQYERNVWPQLNLDYEYFALKYCSTLHSTTGHGHLWWMRTFRDFPRSPQFDSIWRRLWRHLMMLAAYDGILWCWRRMTALTWYDSVDSVDSVWRR